MCKYGVCKIKDTIMIAPQLTEAHFKFLQDNNMTEYSTIGKVNTKNVKGEFSKTVPKVLRDDESFNAYLIIKNHMGRWKYLGMFVEEIAGALHIRKMPEIVWAGYVSYGNSWYAVPAEDLVRGVIKDNSKIILPEIETVTECTEEI